MRSKVRVYEWYCDFCGKSVRVETTTKYSAPPPGWGTKEVGGFGLTNYSKSLDCCDECMPKKLVHGPGETFHLE